MHVKHLFAWIFISVTCNSQAIDELSCSFGNGQSCSFFNGSFPNEWKIVRNSLRRRSQVLDGPLAGPPRDGAFLQLTGLNGHLESPFGRLAGNYCFSIEYYLYGPKAHINIFA